MALVLGIHVGHHSSCALVDNDRLVCAVQQERITRRKYDDYFGLTNDLPVAYCLQQAGASMADVQRVCTSFQAVSPSGFGLHQPLIAPEFSLFDPFDPRHFVLSHHRAHAACTFGLSGFNSAAVLVCDLAGSATVDGQDFNLPFAEWYSNLTSSVQAVGVISENLSIYDASSGLLKLIHRRFAAPHAAGDSFVQSPASLYENVSRFVFGGGEAYGQLMALAAYGESGCGTVPSDLVEIDESTMEVRFRNDWQHAVPWRGAPFDRARLAWATQQATELALLAYARLAKRLTGADALAVAGGIFLNIPSNSKIAASRLFGSYFVPSSPHDAGISIGCALHAARSLNRTPGPWLTTMSSDRLGRDYADTEVDGAVNQFADFVAPVCDQPSDVDMARLLDEGNLIARWSGRSEFGPRALGGRSFLATPRTLESKHRLNRVKGRQHWRPVAPVVTEEACQTFFIGCEASHTYMSYTHRIRSEYVPELPALAHPDGTTRAQVLRRAWDPALHSLLRAFGERTGFPMLINTSLNGAGEPIVETPAEAVRLFLRSDEVGYLLVGRKLFARRRDPGPGFEELWLRTASGTSLSTTIRDGTLSFTATLGRATIALDQDTYEFLARVGRGERVETIVSAAAANLARSYRAIMRLIGYGVLEVGR